MNGQGRGNGTPARHKKDKQMDKLSASEALYGFCAWLTCRKEKTVMSASNDAAPIVELIGKFINRNGLDEPREGWEKNILTPL